MTYQDTLVLEYIEYGATGSQRELLEAQRIAMMRWSEAHYCAGWMMNLAWRIWDAASWDDQARRIVELAEMTGVWILSSSGYSESLDNWKNDLSQRMPND